MKKEEKQTKSIRLYNQYLSTFFNVDNNNHESNRIQGLSIASIDRYASLKPFLFISFFSHEKLQTVITAR